MAIANRPDARLPTRFGDFRVATLGDGPPDQQPVALVCGEPSSADAPLVRIHSECLTGDVFGSLRCDCGDQLVAGLAMIQEAGCGVLLYLRQEGRGTGLANKLLAYRLQDEGLDTVEANLALGLPADARDYGAAAAVLAGLGLSRVRLLTNNPAKAQALLAHGIEVVERVPVEISPNRHNRAYMETKATRMGHLVSPTAITLPHLGTDLDEPGLAARQRPAVTVHYAQTLDGRIATRSSGGHRVSGEESLRFAHQLRADHDAVMVGIGTVLAADPRLTVRHVESPSPVRVVLDSRLRLPLGSHLVRDDAAPTVVFTTSGASSDQVAPLRAAGLEVLVVRPDGAGRPDLGEVLRRLGELGLRSLLIEGGATLITSALQQGMVDRLLVRVAPLVLGRGIGATGDPGIGALGGALTFRSSSFRALGGDVIFDGVVAGHAVAG